MKLIGNTVLITGGSTGIGFEIARQLVNLNNKVIICSRSIEKLEAAKRMIPSLHIFKCDISDKSECEKLFNWINNSFSECNILINNAAIVHKTNFQSDEQIISKAELEMQTNYFGPLRLTKLFLPFFEKKENASIIYITTGLVYAPKAVYPVYCSTKAALHSFIQTLRLQLKSANIKITEVLMPAVNTLFHDGNPPRIAISASKAVQEMIAGLIKDKMEIKVAGTKIIYLLSRVAPSFAFKKINEL
ncbi:MAG: SDR family NAD(P)-dependent oxidoreductase [Ignavibacteria bacterium]|nr:SDR family NAD(P)-dependent oxidoreductase [Ignavibacteria bacterium]